ncbi:MAG: ATP-binding protein, partial [Bacteroidota bacterium]
MRLTALQLINFRGFDHAAFDFHPQFNVFIGQNGAGKTALMEALAIAAGTWLKGIAGQRAPTIQRSDARQRGFRENGRDRYEDQYPISITAAGRIHEEDLVWTRRLGSATGKTTKKEAESLIHKAQEADRDIQDNSPDLVLPLVAYYGAGRLWESMRVTERRRSKGRDAKRETSRRSGYNDSMDRRINGQSFATWMEHEDRIGYEQGAPTVYYETVCQAAAAMLQDVRSVRYSPSAVSVVAEFEDGR